MFQRVSHVTSCSLSEAGTHSFSLAGSPGGWGRFGLRLGWLGLWMAFLMISPGAWARLVIVGETVHRTTVTAGASVTGSITILNRGTGPAEVRVYQTDYTFTSTGESVFGPPGTHAQSNAGWLALDNNQLTLAPDGSAEVNYRGQVPVAGVAPGTYWSLIMVEQTEPVQVPEAGLNPNERKAAIRTVVRHAIQVVHDLGQPEAPAMKILGRSLDHDSQQKTFLLDVENRGAWMIRPEVGMELFDARGGSVGNVASARVRLYPTCSFRYRFDLTSIPAGRYTALVVLDTGDENVSGAQYSLEVP